MQFRHGNWAKMDTILLRRSNRNVLTSCTESKEDNPKWVRGMDENHAIFRTYEKTSGPTEYRYEMDTFSYIPSGEAASSGRWKDQEVGMD